MSKVSREATVGNVANLMQWLFVLFINFQLLQVKFINKLQLKMFVYLPTHIWCYFYLTQKLKGKQKHNNF